MVYFLLIFINDDLKANFQAGVDKLYNKLNGLGFTPAGKTPDNICTAIDKMYIDRYTTGYNKGVADGRVGYYTKAQYDANYTSGYNNGYNDGYAAGRTQGQADVIANPGAYGISVALSTIRLKIGYPRNSETGYVNLTLHKDASGNVSYISFAPQALYFGNSNEIRFSAESFS